MFIFKFLTTSLLVALTVIYSGIWVTHATPVVGEDDLRTYAVSQMNFVLNHILQKTKDFALKVLIWESENSNINSSIQPKRAIIKRYIEELNSVLNAENAVANDRYVQIVSKLNLLKSSSTKDFEQSIPVEYRTELQQIKENISLWLDKTAEDMRGQYNRYIEEDPLRHQYFNNLYDDIPRAANILEKLNILVDMTKTVALNLPINFVDLYMQR